MGLATQRERNTHGACYGDVGRATISSRGWPTRSMHYFGKQARLGRASANLPPERCPVNLSWHCWVTARICSRRNEALRRGKIPALPGSSSPASPPWHVRNGVNDIRLWSPLPSLYWASLSVGRQAAERTS